MFGKSPSLKGAAIGLLVGLIAPMAMAASPGPVQGMASKHKHREGLYPLVRVPPDYPSAEEFSGQQGCVSLQFTVDASGKPRDIKVWAQYPWHEAENRDNPSPGFAGEAIHALSQWRFHPNHVDGKPVASHHVIQSITFLISGRGKQTRAASKGTLDWLCSLTLMHGVKIYGSAAAPPPTSAMHPLEENSSAGSGINEGPSVILPTGVLPAGRSASGHARVRFCIDAEGRLRDAEVGESRPEPIYGRAALLTLEHMRYRARGFRGKPVLTCGLSVRVGFAGKPGSSGVIGQINYLRFAPVTQVPTFKSARPVKLELSVPAGVKLPPVAKVEVRFCIDRDGHISEPRVVKAIPARYFDQAALSTVRGWRFASPHKRLCDVYQWVRFPLSGDTGGGSARKRAAGDGKS